MKTRISENSLEANKIANKETAKKRILKVFDLNYTKYFSCEYISKLTGLPEKTVSARINELRYDDCKLVYGFSIDNKGHYRLKYDEEEPDYRPLSLFEQLYSDLSKLSNIQEDVALILGKYAKDYIRK